MSGPPSSIWSGVFSSFAEAVAAMPRAEAATGPFNGGVWQGKVRSRLEAELAALRSGGSIPALAVARDYPLPVLASLMFAQSDAPLSVLDLGGGLASGFLSILAVAPTPPRLEYHVVELPALVADGRAMLAGVEGIHFHEDLATVPDRVDIVHLGSTLQYIEDWRALLARMAGYRPRYLVLADLMAGDIPSYVTTQYYYGDRIPVWFLNIAELVEAVTATGYRLIYKSRHAARILGREGPLPMGDLPEDHRLEIASHLIFVPGDMA